MLSVTSKGFFGLSDCIIQFECMTPIDVAWSQGTMKASVIQNYPEYKGLISVSVYEIKPVHFYLNDIVVP